MYVLTGPACAWALLFCCRTPQSRKFRLFVLLLFSMWLTTLFVTQEQQTVKIRPSHIDYGRIPLACPSARIIEIMNAGVEDVRAQRFSLDRSFICCLRWRYTTLFQTSRTFTRHRQLNLPSFKAESPSTSLWFSCQTLSLT